MGILCLGATDPELRVLSLRRTRAPRYFVVFALTSALSLALTGVTGCGGGAIANSATQTVTSTPPPTANSGYNNLDPKSLPPGVSVANQAVVNKNAQAIPGWELCVGACANGAVPVQYAMAQSIGSPSLNNDATSAAFSQSGTPFGDVMWYYHFGDSKATHFVIDLFVMIDHPENVQALEMAALRNDGATWYKMEVQCDYKSGLLRGFDEATFQWTSLGANCVAAKAGQWQRITLQFSTSGGMTNYEGVSFDGVRQAISASLPPAQAAPVELLGVHFQLDNADTTSGYTAYVDDWTVYSW